MNFSQKKILFLAVACFLGFLRPDHLPAAPTCTPDQSVCLEVDRWPDGSGFDLWAELKRVAVTTLFLEQSGENLEPAQESFSTVVLENAGRIKLLSRKVFQGNLPWNFSFLFHRQFGRIDAVHDDSVSYLLPVVEKRGALVSQGFHGRYSHSDTTNAYAVDFSVPEGTPVFAAREGIVVQAVEHFTRGGADVPETDVNVVRVQHSDFTVAEYAHLRAEGVEVEAGQRVTAGELLGYSGNTGRSTGPHLHFAVHVPIDSQKRRSVPIHFKTAQGTLAELKEGRRYLSSLDHQINREILNSQKISHSIDSAD